MSGHSKWHNIQKTKGAADAWLDEHIAADNALKRLIVENVASSHRTLKVREYNEAL